MAINLRIFTTFLLLLVAAAPSWADFRAVYEDKEYPTRSLVFEVADDGRMLVNNIGGISDYWLFLNGEVYFVKPGPGGPVVSTQAVEAEMRQRSFANVIPFDDKQDDEGDLDPIRYVPLEPTTIAGYDGFHFNFEGSLRPDFTRVVLSDDPELNPRAKTHELYRTTTDDISYFKDDQPTNLDELLAEYAPLVIWQHELKSFDFEPIDPSRFSIPAEPMTLADLPEFEPRPSGWDTITEAQVYTVGSTDRGNPLCKVLRWGLVLRGLSWALVELASDCT